MHKTATFTVKRDVETEITPGKVRMTTTTIGTLTAGYEDIVTERVIHAPDGRKVNLAGRAYLDAGDDLPVLRGDVVEFTDPATSLARELEVVGRRGPFDTTDPDDHVELDLGSEQRTGR